MKETVKNTLERFSREITSNEEVSSSVVISFLDEIVKELDLETIYVSESTGAIKHFFYPFVSSGPLSGTMFYNLIVVQENDAHRLVELFKDDGIGVFDGMMSSAKRATAEGNLAYGYIFQNKCLGFVSFQPKEKRVWNDEDKETIRSVALLIKPFLNQRQLTDRFSYESNISKTNVGIFWYYPRLKLIIVPETTMEKCGIRNFVYRDAPASFVEDLVEKKDRGGVCDIFESFNDGKSASSVSFSSNVGKKKTYRLSLATNRYDDKNNPIEVMGMLERIDEEQRKYETTPELSKIYDKFKERISSNNLAEYHVDLLTGKVTTLKADENFRAFFENSTNFDSLIEKIAETSLAKESRDSFKEIMNTKNLRDNIMKENDSYSIVSNFVVDGKIRRLESSILANNTSICGYTKDVMIFVRDITHIESLNYDRLTGLLTMSHFLAKMTDWRQKKLELNGKACGRVIYYDLCKFKLLNVQMGISKGDETLKRFSELLRTKYPGCVVSRFGDDHFAVLDVEEDKDKSFKNIEEVIEEALNINDEFKIQIKAGVYEIKEDFDPAISADYAQLACQSIKDKALVSIREYDEELKTKTEKKKYIIDHIDEATSKGWINVFYQPVVSTGDISLVAMEALARWDDPKYGFLSPADFISTLEESNLLYKLDVFIINAICHRLRAEIDLGHKVVPVSFNLSRNDFLSCKPFQEIEKAVKKYGIDPKLICVEITESVAMDDLKMIHKAVDQFRKAGHEVWIDDFGSGYSSLSVLKDFAFDEIKIDMSFMRSFNERSKIIVSNVISMASELGIRTLSEGVETKEQLDFLTKAGCERIQGYYFSRPLPYEELTKILESKNIFVR